VTARKDIAVVTGGLSGIGLAATRALLAEGKTELVGARRAGSTIQQKALRANLDGDVHAHALDVADPESVTAFADWAKGFGTPGILVNAAGIYHEHDLIDHPQDLWQATLDINLTGCFHMIRALMPGMQAQGWGRIVSIASTAAHVGAAGYAAYCASKAGLLGLSRATALEGAPHGITSTTISPTWVETEMMEASIRADMARTGKSHEDILTRYRASNPQNALVQADEIAALITFLTSDAARPLTMEDIQVNAASIW
jgi:NAD(P)-dependent dehydrogenase (short-subunit alcohol dehydrogenase family)